MLTGDEPERRIEAIAAAGKAIAPFDNGKRNALAGQEQVEGFRLLGKYVQLDL